ncbi:hypothetical protein [Phenylobacterium sp.]|jgi:hypothetical protein|uniref:hypothetical protein n=1 Tax=Phenylobacterium sp. TaxID=1871053 RepID=UPI002ED864B2
MLATGLHVADAAVVLVVAYVLWGGWLLTIAGAQACWRLCRSPAHRRAGLLLAAGLLAPALHAAAWIGLARFPESDTDLGVAGLVALAGLHLLTVLAAPLLALRRASTLARGSVRRRPARAGRPALRHGRNVTWAR